jgi:hypothetical protein
MFIPSVAPRGSRRASQASALTLTVEVDHAARACDVIREAQRRE